MKWEDECRGRNAVLKIFSEIKCISIRNILFLNSISVHRTAPYVNRMREKKRFEIKVEVYDYQMINLTLRGVFH